MSMTRTDTHETSEYHMCHTVLIYNACAKFHRYKWKSDAEKLQWSGKFHRLGAHAKHAARRFAQQFLPATCLHHLTIWIRHVPGPLATLGHMPAFCCFHSCTVDAPAYTWQSMLLRVLLQTNLSHLLGVSFACGKHGEKTEPTGGNDAYESITT